jgi:beta-lactamase regulating signal transducer with metallopeptidase domain
VYALLLKREASFRLSRPTLLFIIIISLAIPLVQQPFALNNNFIVNYLFVPKAAVLDVEKTGSVANRVNEIIAISSENIESKKLVANRATLPVKHEIRLFPAIYFAGMMVCLMWMFISLACVLRIIATTRKVLSGQHKIRVSRYRINSFTFAGWIVLSEIDFQQHADEIVTHETVHRRKAHYLDVCLMDFLTVLHWFNPFVWALRKELKSVHEYEADYYTLNQGIDAMKYQLLLIKKTVGASRFAIASNFAQSKIKKRITMMNKKFNPKMRWRTLLFLPVTALLTQAFARPGNSVEAYSDIRNMSEPTLLTANDNMMKLEGDSVYRVVYVTSEEKKMKTYFVSIAAASWEQFADATAKISNDSIVPDEKDEIREELTRLENATLVCNDKEMTCKDAINELIAFIKKRELKTLLIFNNFPNGRWNGKMTVRLPEIDHKQPQVYYIIDGKWWWSWNGDVTVIQSIEILEPDVAVKRFGKKAANGAIVMKTTGATETIEFTPPVYSSGEKSENSSKND